jgi:hypothetical protein
MSSLYVSRRWLLGSAIFAPFCAFGANIRLYLKDGSYQIVREYKVEGDRVRYYSTERGDFEEIPLELVDLKKTEGEIKQREELQREEAKAQDEEEKAEREVQKQVASIPQETGVYLIEGENKLKPIKQAEPKVVNNKGRHVLKLVSPVPLISDKSWLELDGAHSANVVTSPRPEFYMRLASEERFGMVRMGDHKGNRVVEKLTIVPVVKEVVEEPEFVDIFRQQVGDMLYKIWPEKALSPGEYGVVEYTEGKVNMTVWDFAVAAK